MRVTVYKSLASSFNNWVQPSLENLELEYKVEYVLKSGLRQYLDNVWPTFDSFYQSFLEGYKLTVTPSIDDRISYRSRTRNKEELLDLIRGYRSYPEFRNETTVDALYKGFANNRPMTMPIVLKIGNNMRVFAGNTRMDVARQMGIDPVVWVVPVPE